MSLEESADRIAMLDRALRALVDAASNMLRTVDVAVDLCDLDDLNVSAVRDALEDALAAARHILTHP